jgi:hypothetical protein
MTEQFLDGVRLTDQTPRQYMLNPDKKKETAPKKKMGAKKPRLHVLDIAPRTDSRGGGAPKSSPVSLPIPPKGFIAPD